MRMQELPEFFTPARDLLRLKEEGGKILQNQLSYICFELQRVRVELYSEWTSSLNYLEGYGTFSDSMYGILNDNPTFHRIKRV